jgi:hypothetical protein
LRFLLGLELICHRFSDCSRQKVASLSGSASVLFCGQGVKHLAVRIIDVD